MLGDSLSVIHMLARWDDFRTTNWVHPEVIYQKSLELLYLFN